MMHRKRNRFVVLLKPLSVLLLLFLVFGVVWLRSSVVSLEYKLRKLEERKAELLRDKKVLVAEQANLLYIGRLQSASVDGAALTFPDRVKVVYVAKAQDKEALKASLRVGGR
ncbi:MAG TPA: hypothetical protein VF790_00125 [Dissulfurispiraceae bacterium]